MSAKRLLWLNNGWWIAALLNGPLKRPSKAIVRPLWTTVVSSCGVVMRSYKTKVWRCRRWCRRRRCLITSRCYVLDEVTKVHVLKHGVMIQLALSPSGPISTRSKVAPKFIEDFLPLVDERMTATSSKKPILNITASLIFWLTLTFRQRD